MVYSDTAGDSVTVDDRAVTRESSEPVIWTTLSSPDSIYYGWVCIGLSESAVKLTSKTEYASSTIHKIVSHGVRYYVALMDSQVPIGSGKIMRVETSRFTVNVPAIESSIFRYDFRSTDYTDDSFFDKIIAISHRYRVPRQGFVDSGYCYKSVSANNYDIVNGHISRWNKMNKYLEAGHMYLFAFEICMSNTTNIDQDILFEVLWGSSGYFNWDGSLTDSSGVKDRETTVFRCISNTLYHYSVPVIVRPYADVEAILLHLVGLSAGDVCLQNIYVTIEDLSCSSVEHLIL